MVKDEFNYSIMDLIEETLKNKMHWKRIATTLDLYLEENRMIRSFILNKEKGMYLCDYDYSAGKFYLYDSFYSDFQEGKIYVLKFTSSKYGDYFFLLKQNNSDEEVKLLDEISSKFPDEIGESYTDLVKIAELALHISDSIVEHD